MVPRTGKRRCLQPSLFRDSARGMRERFRNRNKTLDRKVLEMHKKCRTHAIKIVQHPRTGKLDVFDTKKGTNAEWPPALHSFLATISPEWIQGPDDFAKPSKDEDDDDESDLVSSYRSTSRESETGNAPDSLLSTTEKATSIPHRMITRSRPTLAPLSPTLGGPHAEMIEPQRLIKKEPAEYERLDYRTPVLTQVRLSERSESPPSGVCTPKRLKLPGRPRTPPRYRLGPLSPTLLRTAEQQRQGVGHKSIHVQRVFG